MEKIKHKLPLHSTLPHLKLTDAELTALQSAVDAWVGEFKSVLEANKALCSVNHELTQSVYDNFFQISLTESELNQTEIDMEACEVAHANLVESGVKSSVRTKAAMANGNSALNEKAYSVKTDHYKQHRELFDGILSKFRGRPTRIRLVKLNSKSSVAPHIDYDPSYAVRVIIPVYADPDCVNIFWKKGEVESTTFVPGEAYFLNTGFKHAVMNFSKRDRYTLMISVDGIQDIHHILAP